ncbi:hypothetical protein OAB94_01765 [Flavobacteriaceae bacterium]|nr:hypothetical protein [Flavobacteriaceae bacterium]
MNNELADRPKQQLQVTQKTGSGLEFIHNIPQFVKIRQYKPHHLKIEIGLAFAQISLLNGFKTEIEKIHKADIMEMLLSKYKNISIEEIQEAFKMERYGKLGERVAHFQLFNSEYVSKVLDLYKKWLQDTKIKKNIVNEQPKITEQSEDEKKTILYLGIMNCWDDFLKGNGIVDGYAWVYDWFFERGAFPKHTTDFKRGIDKRAISYVERQWQTAPKTMSVKNYLKELQGSGTMVVICKKIILSDLFECIKLNPKSFVDILKEIENNPKNK